MYIYIYIHTPMYIYLYMHIYLPFPHLFCLAHFGTGEHGPSAKKGRAIVGIAVIGACVWYCSSRRSSSSSSSSISSISSISSSNIMIYRFSETDDRSSSWAELCALAGFARGIRSTRLDAQGIYALVPRCA